MEIQILVEHCKAGIPVPQSLKSNRSAKWLETLNTKDSYKKVDNSGSQQTWGNTLPMVWGTMKCKNDNTETTLNFFFPPKSCIKTLNWLLIHFFIHSS